MSAIYEAVRLEQENKELRKLCKGLLNKITDNTPGKLLQENIIEGGITGSEYTGALATISYLNRTTEAQQLFNIIFKRIK